MTPGYQMIALDAKTGAPAAGFGKNGIVDLKMEDDQPVDPITGEIGLHATPIIAKDVIVVGAAHLEGSAPKSKNHEKGFIRGYDARTGKRLWIFHTIPAPGEFGNNTWEKDSWAYTGNAGVWAQMTIDEELGMVFLPVELPTGDYYGGNRPGTGLFGESVVALDLKTGVRKWHYQTVHHGIWDMDIPCAPILADITVDGRKIKAIAQITKQGWVYVLDRTNGQPVWPIEERPVEKGDVPGEWYSPTQPFVTKPPPFDRQGVSADDVIDFTPELHAEGLKLLSRYKIGPIFTPPVVSKVEGPLGTLILPSVTGGANWQGGALDPETNKLYVYSVTAPSALGLVQPDPTKSDFGYVLGVARANAPPVQTQTESAGPARDGEARVRPTAAIWRVDGLAARPDLQRQLQQARDRLALQDRLDGPAPRIQLPGHAADGRRPGLYHRRHAPRRGRARRGHRRDEVDAQRERGQARRRRTAAALGPRPRLLARRAPDSRPASST